MHCCSLGMKFTQQFMCIDSDVVYFSWDFSMRCAHSSPKSDELVPLINWIRNANDRESESFATFDVVFLLRLIGLCLSTLCAFFRLGSPSLLLNAGFTLFHREFTFPFFRCGFLSLSLSLSIPLRAFYSPHIKRNISMPNETSNFTKSHSIIQQMNTVEKKWFVGCFFLLALEIDATIAISSFDHSFLWFIENFV